MTALYVMESEVGVKIGISKSPMERLRQIQNSSGMPINLRHTREHKLDYVVEQNAHKLLAEKRRAGEWFSVTVDEAIAAIDEAASSIEADRPQDIVDAETVAILKNDAETFFKERLRRIAFRYQEAGQKDEELIVRRIIEEVFEPPFVLDDMPARKGGRR